MIELKDQLKAEWAHTFLYHKQHLTLDLGDRSVFNVSNDVTVIFWAIKARAEIIDVILDNSSTHSSITNFYCQTKA